MQQQAQTGDTVRVQYTAMLDDGSIFAASKQEEGVTFTLGKGEVITGLERTVLGMKPGETKIVTVPPELGFGMPTDERVVTVEEGEIPVGIDPKPGMRLSVQHSNGEIEPAVVTSVEAGKVVLDANHPLAGRALTLEITLLDIN